MSQSQTDLVCVFTKSPSQAIGATVTEWKGQPRIDIRTYVPVIGEDCLMPTKKGVTLRVEQYPELLDAVRRLGDVMGNERVVARIVKSSREEVRVGITTFKGLPLIYIRVFVLVSPEGGEWRPTQRGVSLRVDLYPRLLDAVEALASALAGVTSNQGRAEL